jgi:general secretion pathway protein G
MKKNGFTLIEILVAASIIAVLSVVGVTSFTSINKRSRDARRKSDVEQVRSALEMWRSDNGSYPGNTTWQILSNQLSGLVPNYLPALPADPQTTSNYYYRTIGVSAPYYSYCICANVESDTGSSTCGAGVTNGSSCNYYLKNP